MNREARLTYEFYAKTAEREWARLRRDPFNELEFSTSLRFLKKHLPRRGLILDAGGGPGRYTIELAKKGYVVVLLDLVPANLDVAKRQIRRARVGARVRDVVEGSIVDLSRFRDASFDAVLCLGGPLSHVHPEAERRKALRELTRVAKPQARLFVSVMGKFATMARGIADWYAEYADAKPFERFWARGDDYQWCGRHFAHFFTADELRGLFPKNVTCLEMVGLEGLASPVGGPYSELPKKNPRAYRNWRKSHLELCTHPTVVDVSAHMMFIGRKSPARPNSAAHRTPVRRARARRAARRSV
jgi:SAM-dependent methyltransferase